MVEHVASDGACGDACDVCDVEELECDGKGRGDERVCVEVIN